ncbi:MAG: ABC transporter ATP-binding protein [Paracoccaceae bacterium]
MLELKKIDAGYGNVQVLRGMAFKARAGEILCLLGRNGAGKTTTMKAIMGLVPVTGGSVRFDGQEISRLAAHRIPRLGIGYIPQGRRLFSELTVAENLEIGLMTRRRGSSTRTRVLEMFPRLAERLRQPAGTLSGGEQQMLATARALCLEPKLLLLDEPTEGLQPTMIAMIRETVVSLKNGGTAIVLVEQRVDAVMTIADRVAFVENGRIALCEDVARLKDDKRLFHRYVGV